MDCIRQTLTSPKFASFLHRNTRGVSRKYLKEVVAVWQEGWGCQAPSSEGFLGHLSLLVAPALLLGATSARNHHPSLGRASSAFSSQGMKLILLILNTPDSKPRINPHLLPKEKVSSAPAWPALPKILAANKDPPAEWGRIDLLEGKANMD